MRRSPLLVALVLGLLALGALYAVVSERRLRGEVPGRGAILSLAVTREEFFVATSQGIFESPDGIEWKRHEITRLAQVTSSGGRAFAVAGSGVFSLNDNTLVAQLRRAPSALATNGDSIYAALDGAIQIGEEEFQMDNPHPGEVITLDVAPPSIYAGGISSGLWKSENDGQTWLQLLETPTSAVLAEQDRILVGTPGALLISEAPDRLEFTDLREPVGGLAELNGTFYAVGARLVYRSENGKRGWQALVGL